MDKIFSPKDIIKLFRIYSGTSGIQRYIDLCRQNDLDPRSILNTLSTDNWEMFFRLVPFTTELLQELYTEGALSESEFKHAIDSVSKFIEPVKVPEPLKTAHVPKLQKALKETPKTDLTAGERYLKALKEEEDRLQAIKEQLIRRPISIEEEPEKDTKLGLSEIKKPALPGTPIQKDTDIVPKKTTISDEQAQKKDLQLPTPVSTPPIEISEQAVKPPAVTQPAISQGQIVSIPKALTPIKTPSPGVTPIPLQASPKGVTKAEQSVPTTPMPTAKLPTGIKAGLPVPKAPTPKGPALKPGPTPTPTPATPSKPKILLGNLQRAVRRPIDIATGRDTRTLLRFKRQNRYKEIAAESLTRTSELVEEFTQNPIGFSLKAPLRLVKSILPNKTKRKLTEVSDFINGKQLQRKLFPYLESGLYSNTALLQSLSQLTGWVDIESNGKLTLGPVKWMNQGWRGMLSNFAASDKGSKWLNFDKEFIKSTTLSRGISIDKAQGLLTGNFRNNSKARTRRATKKYINGEIGLLGFFFAATIGNLITTATTWALEKIGVMQYVREATELFRRVNDAWKYGGGISSEAYWKRADLEVLRGNTVRGRAMQLFARTGRYVIKPFRTVFEGGKIIVGNAMKGIGIYAVSSILVGMNPVAAGALAGGYFAYKTVDNVLKNTFLNAKYLGGVKGYRSFFLGAQATPSGNMWARVANRLASEGFNVGKYNRGWARFLRAYNEPVLNYGKLQFSNRLKTGAFILRNLPIDGSLISLWLVQLGVPLPLALLPIGIDLASKAYVGIVLGLGGAESAIGRLLMRPLAPFSLVIDSLIGAFTLEQVGGIKAFLSNFFPSGGFTLSNIFKSLGILSPGIGGASLAALLVGGPTSWVAAGIIVAAGVVTETIIIGLDMFFRAQGSSLWLEVWPKIENLLKKLGGNVGEGFAGLASAAAGIIGLLQSLMRRDPMGIAISIAFLIIGGNLIISNNVVSNFQQAYFTPTGGAATNAFITNASKSFDEDAFSNNTDKNEIKYSYSFKLIDFNNVTLDDEDIKISSIEITEKDEFKLSGSGEILSNMSLSNSSVALSESGNYILTFQGKSSEGHYSSGQTVNRNFTISLLKPLNELLSDDSKLCNTLTIQVSKVLDENNQEISHNEPTITVGPYCINNQGETTGGELTHIPISSGQITIPGQCFDTDRAWTENGITVIHGHRGLDLVPKPIGTEVYAIASGDGIVTGIQKGCKPGDEQINSSCKGWGNFVILDHGDNYKTIYAHLGNVYVNKNQSVSGGDRLAVVGTTGNSTGVHLHFGIVDGDLDTTNANNYLNPCCAPLNLCTKVTNSGGCSDQDGSNCRITH
ncbi:peptidoglycan DD-metalloendopeptidase family protein [Patescibacteria group bacterium]